VCWELRTEACGGCEGKMKRVQVVRSGSAFLSEDRLGKGYISSFK
jgi:hypothetical protein